MEGYDVECVDNHVSSDFYCIICLKLMRNAIQMKCGHGMCRTCFDGLVQSCQQRNIQLSCPSCRKSVIVNEITDVPMLDRIINSLNVKCLNIKQGCEWVGKLETLEVHTDTCDYCPVQCPNELCVGNIPKYEVKEHLNSCSYSIVDCLCCDFGCDEKILRKDVENHISNSALKHLQLVCKNVLEKDKVIEELQKENEVIKNELYEFKKLNQEIMDMKSTISKFPDYHASVVALNEELKATRIKIDQLNNKQALNNNTEDNQNLEESVLQESRDVKHAVITDKEVLDSLNFIVFQGELFMGKSLSHSDIVSRALNQFKLEYNDGKSQLETQLLSSLEGIANSVTAKMKFSNEYWEGLVNTIEDRFKISLDHQFYQFKLICLQLQYLQENMISNFPTDQNSLCIGKFRYYKEHDRNSYVNEVTPSKKLSFSKSYQLYINENCKLVLTSENAENVMMCHAESLKTIRANNGTSGSFVFEDSVYSLKSNRFIIRGKVLLKIQEA